MIALRIKELAFSNFHLSYIEKKLLAEIHLFQVVQEEYLSKIAYIFMSNKPENNNDNNNN